MYLCVHGAQNPAPVVGVGHPTGRRPPDDHKVSIHFRARRESHNAPAERPGEVKKDTFGDDRVDFEIAF